ncbi:MAG TPA: DUF3105 domain-containing protein [Jatrophihabitans sp.]|nr:DUF3105 domain-containing protein [Jatrophihabitans sp.]
MAQQRPPSAGKPAAKKGSSRPAGKPASGSSANVSTGKAGPAKAAQPRKAPPRKPGKSIVNQRQTPWGLIASAVAVVLFAGAVIVIVIATHKSGTSSANGNCSKMIGSNQTSYLNELQCAKDIKGVTFRPEANRNHVATIVKYDATPPVGGDHSPYWADCTGTVYPNAIANENGVHALEHGAVWITYRPGLSSSEIGTLTSLVAGSDRMMMSPYPGLKTPISLQSWGYQLFVNNATDPRIQQFIHALRNNPKTTPELGAICSQPTFIQHPSTFGHPLANAVTGNGNTMGG